MFALAAVLGHWAKFLWQKRARHDDAGAAFEAAMKAVDAAVLQTRLTTAMGEARRELAEEEKAKQAGDDYADGEGKEDGERVQSESIERAAASAPTPPAFLFADYASFCNKVGKGQYLFDRSSPSWRCPVAWLNR